MRLTKAGITIFPLKRSILHWSIAQMPNGGLFSVLQGLADYDPGKFWC
ncbi:MAG: hypothetical protein ACRC10_09520 [Thermoguttaceae bacterium]